MICRFEMIQTLRMFFEDAKIFRNGKIMVYEPIGEGRCGWNLFGWLNDTDTIYRVERLKEKV